MMTVSLIITTYNRPDALDIVLQSVSLQTQAPNEVVIADDGSGIDTREVVEKWRAKGLPLIHTWMPDFGFRASRSRNLALAKASSDYVVMIDGDCLVPPTFVENHLRLSAKNKLCAGGRFLLSSSASQALVSRREIDLAPAFSSFKFKHIWFGKLRDLRPLFWRSVRTCNLAVWRSDALDVEGFDESYIGWGGEDSDFTIRLLRIGVRIRSARFAACVAHLDHPENSRHQVSKNSMLFQDRLTLAVGQNRIKSILRVL